MLHQQCVLRGNKKLFGIWHYDTTNDTSTAKPSLSRLRFCGLFFLESEHHALFKYHKEIKASPQNRPPDKAYCIYTGPLLFSLMKFN